MCDLSSAPSRPLVVWYAATVVFDLVVIGAGVGDAGQAVTAGRLKE